MMNRRRLFAVLGSAAVVPVLPAAPTSLWPPKWFDAYGNFTTEDLVFVTNERLIAWSTPSALSLWGSAGA